MINQLNFLKLLKWQQQGVNWIDTLWLFNIAMENGPFIDGLPIENGDFSMAMLVYQMVIDMMLSCMYPVNICQHSTCCPAWS